MRKLRAKFKCHFVTKSYDGNEQVHLVPVYGTSDKPANDEWSQYTPSGKLEMCITAKGGQGFFVPGSDYFLDFVEDTE